MGSDYRLIVILVCLVIVLVLKLPFFSKDYKKLMDVKKKYQNRKVFLCNVREDYSDEMWQLFGSPTTRIKAGDRLKHASGIDLEVESVYGKDDKPDSFVDEKNEECAILVKIVNNKKETFDLLLKKVDGVVALEVTTT